VQIALALPNYFLPLFQITAVFPAEPALATRVSAIRIIE
jgi:hypothetical protein